MLYLALRVYIIMFRLEVASYGGLMFTLMTQILLLVCVVAKRLQLAFYCIGLDLMCLKSVLILHFCCVVLMHTGYCRPTASPPPMAVQELRTTIRVLPPQDCMSLHE